jgi:UDP-galactopyranose mutase
MKVSEVPVEVASRIALSNDIELFGNNKVVGVPYKGWSDLLRNMIDQESITIQYRTLVDIEYIERNLLGKYDIVVITSPIFGNPDDYAYRIFSECKYIPGLESRYVDDYVCINNSNKDLDFTRITRYSKFPVESPGDRVGVEYPANRFTPGAVMCYPRMNKDASSSLYDKFSRIAESGRRLGTVVSLVGRLATNQYLNIDQVIQKALDSIQLSVLYSDDTEFVRYRRCYGHE